MPPLWSIHRDPSRLWILSGPGRSPGREMFGSPHGALVEAMADAEDHPADVLILLYDAEGELTDAIQAGSLPAA